METINKNKRLLENQKEVQKTVTKRRVFERIIIGFISVLFVGGGLFYYFDYSIPFSFESIQSNVSNLNPGLVDVPVFDKVAGDYPKQSLYVGLNYPGAGEIRYSLGEEKPTINSTLYSGYGIDVYGVNVEGTTILSAIAVDHLGDMSYVVTNEYNFVSNEVKELLAIPQADGMVYLSWDASTDPDLLEYRIYVDGEYFASALKNTAFTVSGLTNREHSFAVTVVDKFKKESKKAERKLLLQRIETGEGFHGSASSPLRGAKEISSDFNGDGVVDHKDLRFILEQIEGGASLDELNEVIECWDKPGC